MILSLKSFDLDSIFDANVSLLPSLGDWGTKSPLTFSTRPTDHVPINYNASYSNPIDHGGKSLVLTNKQATNLETVFAESIKEVSQNID